MLDRANLRVPLSTFLWVARGFSYCAASTSMLFAPASSLVIRKPRTWPARKGSRFTATFAVLAPFHRAWSIAPREDKSALPRACWSGAALVAAELDALWARHTA